jgi:hypothetical protein
MDNEGMLWYAIWRLVAISLVTLVAIVGGCTANSNRIIHDMVSRGTPPIEASCAVQGMDQPARAAICATQGKQR